MRLFRTSSRLFNFTPVFCFVMSLTLAPVTFAQAQNALSADDLAEIHRLYAHYNLMLDGGDAQAWADTFTDDGSFNTFVGTQALVAFAEDFIAANPASRHWNSNIHITPTADGAAGIAYLMLWKVSTQPAEIVVTGIYRDELVKTPEGWRFKARLVEIDQTTNP